MLEEEAGLVALTTLASYEPEEAALSIGSALRQAAHAVAIRLMTHELAHVWQDGDGRFSEQPQLGRTSFELFNLWHMLVEGEADLMALVASDAPVSGQLPVERGSDDWSKMMAWSQVIPNQRSFGLRYAHGLWTAGGWEAVREGLRPGPASTEQAMHSAHKGGDVPTQVSLPELPLAMGAPEFLWLDTLGEFGVFSLILKEQGISADSGPDLPRTLQRMATGWDGDRILATRTRSGVEAVLWRTVWDRELDAEQFAQGFLAQKPGFLMQRLGTLTRSGHVVDWVWSSDEAWELQLSALLAAFPQAALPSEADGESAEMAEAVL